MNYIPASQVELNADGKLYEVTVNKLGIASLDGKVNLWVMRIGKWCKLGYSSRFRKNEYWFFCSCNACNTIW